MEKFSEWEDAGGFYYRFMPEQCLEDFFREEREILTVEFSQHYWWLKDPGASGSENFMTKEEAFSRGNEIFDQTEKYTIERIASDNNINVDDWHFRFDGDLVFTNNISGEEKIITSDNLIKA